MNIYMATFSGPAQEISMQNQTLDVFERGKFSLGVPEVLTRRGATLGEIGDRSAAAP
jgi:hypothetical protein